MLVFYYFLTELLVVYIFWWDLMSLNKQEEIWDPLDEPNNTDKLQYDKNIKSGG